MVFGSIDLQIFTTLIPIELRAPIDLQHFTQLTSIDLRASPRKQLKHNIFTPLKLLKSVNMI